MCVCCCGGGGGGLGGGGGVIISAIRVLPHPLLILSFPSCTSYSVPFIHFSWRRHKMKHKL